MTRPSLALIEVFSAIPDFRQARGRGYPLPAILALAAAAMLGGYRSYSAIAEWGRNYGQSLAKALGFTDGKTPCAATLHHVFRHLDKSAVEAHLGGWAEAVLSSTPRTGLEAEAIDGKSLRGSQKQGALGAHLLSADERLKHPAFVNLAGFCHQSPRPPDPSSALTIRRLRPSRRDGLQRLIYRDGERRASEWQRKASCR